VTPAKREARQRPSRIERTAYHEAGHAVAAYLRRLRFTSISIIPYRGTLGHCEFSEAPVIIDLNAHSIGHARRRMETLIIVSLAGVVAECLLTGRHNWRGAHADLHDAARYASFVTGSDDELGAYVRWLWEHTKMLLGAPPCWLAIQQLAAVLIEDRRLGERRARAIIGEALKRGAPKRKRKARAHR
jgi:hypothetical protein